MVSVIIQFHCGKIGIEMKRLELKYQTHRGVSELIFRELRNIFKIDKNAQSSISYENVSIYYDDKSMQSYREKHEGDNVRNKVRMRMSRPHRTKKFTRCQLEIKERRGVETLKRSFPVAIEDQKWATENVTSYMLSKHDLHLKNYLLPAVGVRYIRTAIDSSIMPGIRITFDTDIKSFHEMRQLEVLKAQPLILPTADCLIEIKSTRGVPAIVSNLIQKYRLQRVTYSKYAKALENMHQVLDGNLITPEYFRHAAK